MPSPPRVDKTIVFSAPQASFLGVGPAYDPTHLPEGRQVRKQLAQKREPQVHNLIYFLFVRLGLGCAIALGAAPEQVNPPRKLDQSIFLAVADRIDQIEQSLRLSIQENFFQKRQWLHQAQSYLLIPGFDSLKKPLSLEMEQTILLLAITLLSLTLFHSPEHKKECLKSKRLFTATTLTPKKSSTQCFISVLVNPDSTFKVY